MGQKTSIYLPAEVAAKVKASGLPLIELVRRGLESGERETIDRKLDAILEALAARE